MLLTRSIGPVKKVPSGTTTFPPPAFAQASMALAKALVFAVFPSPTAPNSVTLKACLGICGSGMSGSFQASAATRTVQPTDVAMRIIATDDRKFLVRMGGHYTIEWLQIPVSVLCNSAAGLSDFSPPG